MKIKFLIIFVIVLSSANAQGISLIGKWKLTRVEKYTDSDTLFIDINKIKETKDILRLGLQKEAEQENDDELKIDSSEIESTIDFLISNIKAVEISFKKNNTFKAVNNDVLIPSSVPGYKFGDSVEGSWENQNKVISLNLPNFVFKFELIKIDKKNLVIQPCKGEISMYDLYYFTK